MTTIPPGAFQDAADHLTRAVKREDGKDVTAFNQQAKALTAIRSEVIGHGVELDALASRVAALEAQPQHPFP